MSPAPLTCLVLPYERGDGPANMALDEALLDLAASDPSTAWFRTYGWTEPTLSLGYFQAVAELEADPRRLSVPWVRRPTGGGAIWHDREVTYALALPSTHPLTRPSTALYRAVHGALAELLRGHGVEAGRRGAQGPEITGSRPFFCFTDRDPEDIVMGGLKIVGSAQRRRAGAVLQHGSVLLAHSEPFPELRGAGDLAPIRTEPQTWSDPIAETVPRALGLAPRAATFSPELRQRARELETTIYRRPSWNRRR